MNMMRKFAGKSFYSVGWKHRKVDAEKVADFDRKRGGRARVVKSWNPSAPPRGRWGYEVFVRYGG